MTQRLMHTIQKLRSDTAIDHLIPFGPLAQMRKLYKQVIQNSNKSESQSHHAKSRYISKFINSLTL